MARSVTCSNCRNRGEVPDDVESYGCAKCGTKNLVGQPPGFGSDKVIGRTYLVVMTAIASVLFVVVFLASFLFVGERQPSEWMTFIAVYCGSLGVGIGINIARIRNPRSFLPQNIRKTYWIGTLWFWLFVVASATLRIVVETTGIWGES